MSRFKIIRDIKLIIYIIRKAKLFVVFFGMLLAYNQVCAQGKLSRQVDIPRYERASIRQIFDSLSQKESFYFSFNSDLVNLDSLVTKRAYNGVLIDYLSGLLGERFSFKETTSHILISYAPERMDVAANISSKESNRAMISGYIKDIRTNRAIANASVYERQAFRASTLSDKNGFFALDIKNPENLVAIALSKENYRDTSIILLLPVEAYRSLKKRKVGYYQVNGAGKTVYNNFFGNFFTSSAQKIQSLNLGGMFAYSPVQVSLTPGLSTHGFFDSQVVNNFSLNIIGGSSAGVDGVELAGALNINQYDVDGAQFAGVLNIVGGNVKGLQMGGVANVVLHNLSGVQVAGIWNQVDTVKSGFQIAGAVNLGKEVDGIQIAGLANRSKGEVRNQIAGGFNIAKSVSGIQMAGLLNIADSSDYPIGVFNWIKNGTKQLSAGIDDSKFFGLSFRSGGRVMYSLIGFGLYLDDPILKYGADFGIGAHLLTTPKFALSAELLQRTNFGNRFNLKDVQRISFRIIPSISLSQKLQLYAAPSFQYSEAVESVASKAILWKLWGTDRQRNTFHGGGTVGITYVF